MDGFFQNLKLESLIEGLPLKTRSSNLEDIYSEINERSKTESAFLSAKAIIEERVFDYFNSFAIPDNPTIYDFLLLSLRSKDLIASFNWDPLLIQAGNRLLEKGLILPKYMPKTIFLHGNVGVVFDPKSSSSSMHSKYNVNLGQKSKLLFPVKDKNYADDIVIKDSWKMVTEYLKRTYILTIFGYSAPETDTKAKEILQSAWDFYGQRDIEEIEFIDILNEEKIINKWSNFIGHCHFHCSISFFDSMCGRYPRRTADHLFDVTMQSIWGTDNMGFRDEMSFEDIKAFIRPLVFDEILHPENLTNPYRTDFNPD